MVVSVVVQTTARAMTPPGPGGNHKLPGLGVFNWTWLAWLLGLAMLPLLFAKHRRACLLAGLGALLLLTSCAGESAVGVARGTPPGTYNLTISGTSGSLTRSTTVSLTVN